MSLNEFNLRGKPQNKYILPIANNPARLRTNRNEISEMKALYTACQLDIRL